MEQDKKTLHILDISKVFVLLIISIFAFAFFSRNFFDVSDYSNAEFKNIGSFQESVFKVVSNTDIVNQDGSTVEIPSPSKGSSWIGTASTRDSSYVGLRFSKGIIPQNTVIVSARIELTSPSEQTTQFKVKISSENSTESTSFTPTNLASDRSMANTSRLHIEKSQWKTNNRYYIDVTNIIKDIVGKKGLNDTQVISLLIKGDGEKWQRRYFYNTINPEHAPRLIVNYQ